jgi:alpha-methylacyl-CoA racemase
MSGPLSGVRIIEIAGMGPGPLAGMLLSDMGADVIRIDRTRTELGESRSVAPGDAVLLRGRRSIAVDLKEPEGVDIVLKLVDQADGLFEPFRPGVAERLGIGPTECLSRNSRLVYGRMTGWGQDGPLAATAGHDINYIALAGALYHFGRAGGPPAPPLNVVGDFGGGGMLLAFGMVCGLFETGRSGRGQVVDAAMVDGVSVLMSQIHGLSLRHEFDEDARGTNLLDSGAPYYDVYECADGEFVSIGAIEPQFYDDLLSRLHLEGAPDRNDPENWPAIRDALAGAFRARTRAEWCDLLEGTDTCFAPVLRMREAKAHPHMVARTTFTDEYGAVQPAPAPRFSRTPGAIRGAPAWPGEHTDEILRAELRMNNDEIAALRVAGVVA